MRIEKYNKIIVGEYRFRISCDILKELIQVL